MIGKIKATAALIREIGVIVGLPALIYVAFQMHELQQESHQAQVASLEAQIEILKEQQYPRAAAAFNSQREMSENELDLIERSIDLIGGKKIDIREFNSRLLCVNLKPS